MPQTARQFWQNLHGKATLNFNWDAIDHDSVVLISASEYYLDDLVPDSPDHRRFVGDARVTVCNVSPHGPPFDPNHGVTFVVHLLPTNCRRHSRLECECEKQHGRCALTDRNSLLLTVTVVEDVPSIRRL